MRKSKSEPGVTDWKIRTRNKSFRGDTQSNGNVSRKRYLTGALNFARSFDDEQRIGNHKSADRWLKCRRLVTFSRQPRKKSIFDSPVRTHDSNDKTDRQFSYNGSPPPRRSLTSAMIEENSRKSVRNSIENDNDHYRDGKSFDRSHYSDNNETTHSNDKRKMISKRSSIKQATSFDYSSSDYSSETTLTSDGSDVNKANDGKKEEPPLIPRELKKNRRLFPNGMPWNEDSAEEDETRKPLVITSASLCPYCRMRDPGFVNADCLKMHYASVCNALCRCDFCDKIVEIAELTEHQLNRCPFVDRSLETCPHCGLARFIGQELHPKCRQKLAPIGSAWCPLCSAHIIEDRDACWRRHLIDDCYNNPRNKRWPQIRDSIRDDQKLDKRGDMLLQNLLKNEPREIGSMLGTSTMHSQIGYSSTIDVNQLRNAMRRLNREYRSRSRLTHMSIMNQRIIHHDDSD